MKYEYYYNNMPDGKKFRNNLIYTSLISEDEKTFVQWYYNDTEYHYGKNEVVDPDKMDEKWRREVKFLTLMSERYPNYVPEILEIDETNRKLYLAIDGRDFWDRAGTLTENYDSIVPDWREQMLDIMNAHKQLNWYKMSLHPSSYFVVDGKLKSINYFFTHEASEETIIIDDVMSHISVMRRELLLPYKEKMNIDYSKPTPLRDFQRLAFESFRSNYPDDFIEECLRAL
jgi:hypothetical protein